MPDQPLTDVLEGSGSVIPSFQDLDQHFRLKPRAYVELCMPPAFRKLQEKANLLAVRRAGYWPMMYHLTFEPADMPLAFAAPLQIDFQAHLRRYSPAGQPGAPDADRLLIDLRFAMLGRRGLGKPEEMSPGGPDETGWDGAEHDEAEREEAGKARIVQVFTRPMAPPGERQVTELPEEFRLFREHPWEGPYPTWDLLGEVPPGFSEAPGEVAPHDSVWGLPNTDVNQHVNLTEYISKMEDHLSRMLYAAGSDLRRHRVIRAELLFMKPFFPGEPYRVSGRLWRRGAESLLLGGVFKQNKDGAWPPANARPAVMARFEGEQSSSSG